MGKEGINLYLILLLFAVFWYKINMVLVEFGGGYDIKIWGENDLLL